MKPRIKINNLPNLYIKQAAPWICVGNGVCRGGATPGLAYHRWALEFDLKKLLGIQSAAVDGNP